MPAPCCCSLLRCLGNMQENNQKRGQQQRAASEPATHANHSLAHLGRSAASSESKDSCQTHSWGSRISPQPQKACLAHSAILSPGDGVCGLLTEIQLGLPVTKRRLLLCPLAPLPSSVLSAEAVTLQQDSLLPSELLPWQNSCVIVG